MSIALAKRIVYVSSAPDFKYFNRGVNFSLFPRACALPRYLTNQHSSSRDPLRIEYENENSPYSMLFLFLRKGKKAVGTCRNGVCCAQRGRFQNVCARRNFQYFDRGKCFSATCTLLSQPTAINKDSKSSYKTEVIPHKYSRNIRTECWKSSAIVWLFHVWVTFPLNEAGFAQQNSSVVTCRYEE